MSALEPGWVESLGKEQATDTEAESRMRRKGHRPVSERTYAELLEKGRKASSKAARTQRLDRVLGPITED